MRQTYRIFLQVALREPTSATVKSEDLARRAAISTAISVGRFSIRCEEDEGCKGRVLGGCEEGMLIDWMRGIDEKTPI